MDWAQNHIICKDSFRQRSKLLHLHMFDQYTNSNAEAEHSVLRKESLGVQANGKLYYL